MVWAMWQLIWRSGISRVRKLKGVGSSSPGWTSKLRPVDGAAVEAWWRAGFQAALAEAEALEGFAEEDRGGFAGAARGVLLLAAVDEAVEEGAGGDDGGAAWIVRPSRSFRPPRIVRGV